MGKFRKANSNGKGLSHPAVKVLIALNIILLGVGLYIYFHQNTFSQDPFIIAETQPIPSDKVDSINAPDVSNQQEVTVSRPKVPRGTTADHLKPNASGTESTTSNKLPSASTLPMTKQTMPTVLIQAKKNSSSTRYTVAKGIAHFHNQPDPSTKRKAFINHWNKAVLEPLDEQNGFIYIVYTNHLGQTSKGWLQLKDLEPIR